MASAEVPIVFDFDFNFNEEFDMSAVPTDADAGDEDEDESDNDHSDTDGGSKNDSSIKKRPTIREHSKAQREKRKNMLETLERDAAVVTKQKEEKDAQFQIVFDAIENSRKLYLRNVALFLQSWFGSSTLEDKNSQDNRPEEDSSKYDPLDESRSSWMCVVDVQNAVIAMPLTMAFWVPPIISSTTSAATSLSSSSSSSATKTPRHQRLNLRTFRQMKGYKAGYSLLCSSIAKYGTNVVDSLLFSASIKTDTCAVDGRKFASGFSVVSKNALLCGGSNEISYDGFIYCRFNEENRLNSVEIYFNGIEFHQLMFSTFGPSIYRPMTLRDKMIVGEPSSFINVCQIVTTLTARKNKDESAQAVEDDAVSSVGLPFTVLSANSTAESVFGSICGQQLIPSNDALGDALWSKALNWMPQFEHLDALRQMFPDRFLQWSLCSSRNSATPVEERWVDADDKDDAKNAFVQILPYRYDPPGTLIPPAEPSASQKPKKRPSITSHRCEEESDDHNKNAVQAILKRSRSFIVSALQRAKVHATLTTDLVSEMDKKASKGEGKEVKRGSIMSIQSSSTDISRVCSKELDDDWLGTYELMDILSDPSPMQSRRSSIDPQAAWSNIVGNNSTSTTTTSSTTAAASGGAVNGCVTAGAAIKPEVAGAVSADAAANSAAGKKAKSDKATTKLSKKVNFEEAEREAAQQIEGGRVTPSLVKGPLSPALYGPSVSDEEEEVVPARLPPNRALWIIHRCRPVRSESVAEVLLEDFLNRILLVYGGRIPNNWTTLDEGHSHHSHHPHGGTHAQHSSSSFPSSMMQDMSLDGQLLSHRYDFKEKSGKSSSHKWRFSSTGEIIGLLARAKRLLAAIRSARAAGGRDVKASLKRFVRWVMAVDHASSSLLLELEDEHGEALSLLSDGNDNAADRARALSATKRGVEYVSASIGDSNEDDDENSSRRRKIRHGAEFEVLTPTGLTPVAEKQLLKSISQDLSVFFTQVRTSGVVKRLTLMLRPTGDASGATSAGPGSVPIVLTEEESKPAEQFIFLCWTRHSHTLVQELMESTKQYVAEKQYAEALAALSEVIKIDPFFAEAYNRRATVHFGLKCADDCFADIERVLRIESMHYGALSGKGLMLMKLGRYTPAIEAFERAIAINPVLGRGALKRHLQQCLEANASVNRRMHSQAVLASNYPTHQPAPSS